MEKVIFELLYFVLLIFTVDSYVEKDLLAHLFNNYSSVIRPVQDQKTPIIVTFNMKLMRILSVEEKNQKLASQAYFGIRWKNDFLKWNPSEWGNIKYLAVRPDMVWIPDIILKNNADSNAITIQKDTDKVWLKHTGKNSWYPKVMMISSFKADVTYFPFDSQNFIFHFGSWSFGENKLRIVKDEKPILDRHYLNDSEWELVSMQKQILRSLYDSDAYREIMFTYFFSRKPTYSVITTIVPSIGLMSMALFSYLLPPDNGERITILITSLLAFTIFLVEINGSLPRNSDSVPIIQVFYMITMAECILCFIVTCMLARLLDKSKDKKLPFNVPTWVKIYLFKVIEKQSNDKPKMLCKMKCGCKSIPLMVQTQQKVSRNNSNNNNNNNDINNSTNNSIDGLNTDMTTSESCSSVTMLMEDVNAVGSEYNKLNTHACDMTWGMFAECLDKICLRIFSFLFLTSSVGILIPAYYRKPDILYIHDI